MRYPIVSVDGSYDLKFDAGAVKRIGLPNLPQESPESFGEEQLKPPRMPKDINAPDFNDDISFDSEIDLKKDNSDKGNTQLDYDDNFDNDDDLNDENSSSSSSDSGSAGDNENSGDSEEEEKSDIDKALDDMSGEADKDALDRASERGKDDELKNGNGPKKDDMTDVEQDIVDGNGKKSEQIKEQIKKAVNEAIEKEKDKQKQQGSNSEGDSSGEGGLGGGSKELDILSSVGGGNFSNDLKMGGEMKKWKRLLKKALETALGMSERYDSNTYNKRLGVMGRDVDTPELVTIALLIDVSASMGFDKFAKPLLYIDKLLNGNPMLKNVNVVVLPWGYSGKNDLDGGEFLYKGETSNGKIMRHFKRPSQALTYLRTLDAGKFSWSTFYTPAIVAMAMDNKAKKFDAMIVCTDGEFSKGSIDSDAVPYVNQIYRASKMKRIMYVLTPVHDKKFILRLDPKANEQERMIVCV